MKSFFLFIFLWFAYDPALAQEKAEELEQPQDHHLVLKEKDSVCLETCFLKAHWEAHMRTFFMSTVNEGALKDDYALAAGAGIGLLTQPLYGFQFGMSGFFIYNLSSSDLTKPDPSTKAGNRYEVGLFDIENPSNKNDLDRLEELYVKYNVSKSAITLGKININTPFVNPQDGRMRPTLEEGVWLNIHESKRIGFNGGWLWDISPRSTIRWFKVSESIGINPMGFNTDGSKSNYAGNITSKGLAIGNVYYQPNARVKINLWNAYLHNVMNTGLAEIRFSQQKNKTGFYQAVLFLHQDALNQGGNTDQSKTYIDQGAQSNAISAQVGVKKRKNNSSLNYTHITGDGRYLMPREWGRDPFYTFLPRERNEGFGKVHAFVAKSTQHFHDDQLQIGLAYGYFILPDVKDYRLNKYGMPSYHQLNIDASYQFKHFLKGMTIRMLLAQKLNAGETYDDLRYVYNKVNMLNFNFIVDFKI